MTAPSLATPPGAAGADPVARRGPLATLWIAKAVASLGRTMSLVALPWFVLQVTGSGTQTGFAVASSGLAIAVVAFGSGALIDRSGGKRAAVTCLALAGPAIGLVPLLYRLDLLALWPLLVLVFVASALDSVANAAVETLVPGAARAARVPLESANAAMSGIDRFALLLMPVVTGVAIALVGAATVIWIDTVASLVAAALLAVAAPAGTRAAPGDGGVRGYAAAVRDGLRTLRGDRVLVSLTLTGTVLNALVSSFYSIVVLAYAAEVFGSSLHFAGMLAAVGGGSLAGALLYGVVGRRLPRRAWLLLSCFGTAGALLAMATVPGQVLAMVVLAASGVLTAPLAPLVAVVFQERVPAGSLGRVLSARNSAMLAGIPLGVLVTGVALDLVGLAGTILLIGALTLAVAVAVALLPALRTLAGESR